MEYDRTSPNRSGDKVMMMTLNNRHQTIKINLV